MKKSRKWLILGIFLVIGALIIIVYNLNSYSQPSQFKSTTDIQIDTSKIIHSDVCQDINDCIIKSDQLIDDHLPLYLQTISGQDVSPGNIDEGHVLAEYKVAGNQLQQSTKQQLTTEQQQMAQKQFDFFTQLVPAEWRKNLTKYVAIEDSNLSAYIMRLGEHKVDGQALGIDVYNMSNTADMDAKLILIHEFAHLFSDHYDQYVNDQSCEMTITDKSLYCLKETSYLNQFYLDFWKNVPKDWVENSSKATEDTVEFYQLNKDKFITTYAASNPYEDFAESFTEFVIRPYHDLTATNQQNEKIEFFYQYPELVLLRYQLLQNLTQSNDVYP